MTKIQATKQNYEKLNQKYCRVLLTEDKSDTHRLVETKDGYLEYRQGIGKKTKVNARKFRTTIRSIVRSAKSHKLTHLALELKFADFPKLEDLGSDWFYQTIGENLELANYEFYKYKTDNDKPELREIFLANLDSSANNISFNNGLKIGQAANLTRDIANTTAEDMTPSLLAKTAKESLKNTNVKVKVLDDKKIKALKMGLLEAVGKGANDKPKFIIMEYFGNPKAKSKKLIVLIGKGITYDSGGLNIKPSGGMHDMHLDMSGGASMIGTMKAISDLKIKKNVVALIPAAENSVSAASMRCGDIATSMSGKTVEILHTDAEGRMVLADAMTYADKNYKPSVMIDVATLTGASLVAVGQHASVVLTKNADLQNKLVELGEESGDYTWPLPLWDEYKASLKSSRADISNIASNFSRWGGCIEGGTFLSFFAPKNIPWAHIDMAPRMESIPSDKLAKGATGEPVRMLVRFVQTH